MKRYSLQYEIFSFNLHYNQMQGHLIMKSIPQGEDDIYLNYINKTDIYFVALFLLYKKIGFSYFLKH